MVGVLALLLAAVYAVDAWQTLSMGRWHKPGAAIFPIAVGLLLAISAISVLLERHGGADDPMPATFSLPAGSDLRRLLQVLARVRDLLPGDAAARQHDRLGACFCWRRCGCSRMIPTNRCCGWRSMRPSCALVFELFFVRLLKVQMPAGVLKQWLF